MSNWKKLGWVVALAGATACTGGAETAHGTTPRVDADDPLAGLGQELTPLATQCTFNTSTGLMTVTVATGETAVLQRSAADSSILQNGQACDNPVTASTLKKITITGSGGDETVLLDFTYGLFATGTSSVASSGIAIDMGGGSGDKLAIKGTNGVDTFTFGADALLLNTDAYKDITYTGVENFVVSLGDGDDVFTASGSAVAGAVFPSAITVFGGPGADTFNEGSVTSPNETIYGGSGTDTVSYASRTAAITVTVGTGADDGLASENDDIKDDVEVITGGTAADSLTASALGNTLNGGPGADTLIGGAGNDTLNGGTGNDTLRGGDGNDTLNGDDGDDTFDEGSASNGMDVMNGGNGTDTVDYSARTNALTVTMDGASANDGETNEKDNVKGDVENIIGGSGNDNITGNSLNNVIDGRAGNDILNGGAGDDTFLQGSAADGNDTISGGLGVDLVTYASRTADITAALDGTTASGDIGNSEADILGTDVENLYGGSGADTLTGNASANEIVGGAGNDTISGGAGDDTLEGGADDDTINCGAGFDVNVGAVGTDTVNSDCEI
ncbi:MAG: calcium-binding protein [Deltaproteobacteria bacterium]|nr:calcium-binding protein [Deltaproteobacteria bacterium]